MEYIRKAAEWFEQSLETNPKEWGAATAIVVAIMFGMWLHKKLTKKPEKH